MYKFAIAASVFFASFFAHAADLNQAEQLLNNGKAGAALNEAEAVLADDPTNPNGRFIQGLALAQLERSKEAIAVFRDLSSDFRELPEPFNNLAVLLAQAGDYDGAREALEQAVKNNPNYTEAWENLADIYSLMATLAYEKVLALEPTNAMAKLRLDAFNRAVPMPKPAAPAITESAAIETVAADPENTNEAPAVESPPLAAGAVVADNPSFTSEQRKVMQSVSNWANAWANQDTEQYLAAYSTNYEPQDNLSRDEWEAKRRSRLANPAAISLQVGDPSVTFLDDDLATVKFQQDYRSDAYQDSVRKTLLMERSQGSWLIVREQSIR